MQSFVCMGRRSAQPEWTNTHDRSLEKVLLENDCELAPLTGKPVKDIEPLFAPFPSAKLNAKIKQLRAMLQSRTRSKVALCKRSRFLQ